MSIGKLLLLSAVGALVTFAAPRADAAHVSWSVIDAHTDARDIAACSDGLTLYKIDNAGTISVTRAGGIGWSVVPGAIAPYAREIACGMVYGSTDPVLYALNRDQTFWRWNASAVRWEYLDYLWYARTIAGGYSGGTTFPFFAINGDGRVWLSEPTATTTPLWTPIRLPLDVGVRDIAVVHGEKILYGVAPASSGTDDGLRRLTVFDSSPWEVITRSPTSPTAPISILLAIAATTEDKIFGLDKGRLLQGTVTP